MTERLARFRPRIVLNMLENARDCFHAGKLRRSCKEYLAMDIEHLGIIRSDPAHDVALNSMLPVIVYKPDCMLSQAVYRIADKLIQHELDGAELPDTTAIDESYRVAEMEAKVDEEELAHGRIAAVALAADTLDRDELLKIIREQQVDIERFKRENQALKAVMARSAKSQPGQGRDNG
jgi:flagellar biosynthesis protein FlhG